MFHVHDLHLFSLFLKFHFNATVETSDRGKDTERLRTEIDGKSIIGVQGNNGSIELHCDDEELLNQIRVLWERHDLE